MSNHHDAYILMRKEAADDVLSKWLEDAGGKENWDYKTEDVNDIACLITIKDYKTFGHDFIEELADILEAKGEPFSIRDYSSEEEESIWWRESETNEDLGARLVEEFTVRAHVW